MDEAGLSIIDFVDVGVEVGGARRCDACDAEGRPSPLHTLAFAVAGRLPLTTVSTPVPFNAVPPAVHAAPAA
jgi:hypothetical protein